MEETSTQTIHVEPNRFSTNYHVFLLFIPAIIFVLLIAFIMRISSSGGVAGIATESAQIEEQQ